MTGGAGLHRSGGPTKVGPYGKSASVLVGLYEKACQSLSVGSAWGFLACISCDYGQIVPLAGGDGYALVICPLAPHRGACFVQCKPVEKGKEKSLAYN